MLCSALTQKGQATIPAPVRRSLHLEPGDKLEFIMENNRVFIRKIEPFDYEHHLALTKTLSEWDSSEDNDAYKSL